MPRELRRGCVITTVVGIRGIYIATYILSSMTAYPQRKVAGRGKKGPGFEPRHHSRGKLRNFVSHCQICQKLASAAFGTRDNGRNVSFACLQCL